MFDDDLYDDDFCDGEEPPCHYCDGDGWITLDQWNIDDPVNQCDWASGGDIGDTVRCTCCGGSGDAKDCTWW